MKKNLLLFLAGALMDLALAPFYLFPVLFISFPYLCVSLQRASSNRQAFWYGWWFGFGYFVFGLYWISNSLLVDLRFAWLIPFAISLIPAACGIFTGLVGYSYKRLKINAPVYLAILWVIAEYIKGIFPFGGFPWNDIGYTSLFSIYFAQIASIGGIHFVGFVVVFIALLPVYYKQKRGLFCALALIAASFIFGFAKISTEGGKFTEKTVTIIQPNIAQSLKWDPERMRQNFFETMALASKSDSDFTIWPESSIPYPIEKGEAVKAMVASATPVGKVTIASSTRIQGDYEKIWNALYIVDSSAKILDVYDKHHLVPFGEYVPLRSVLPIDKITPGMIDFSAGDKGKVLSARGVKFLPLICYEIIFPTYAKGNYDFIVNITNDAWFGNSTGPQQHLAMARMRAIEQGRPVLRAANTGVSAIIDSNGTIINSIDYGQKGVISSKIPSKLENTVAYRGVGDALFLLMLIIALIRAIFLCKKL
jgi:apolipoprotein N-acyltransferase